MLNPLDPVYPIVRSSSLGVFPFKPYTAPCTQMKILCKIQIELVDNLHYPNLVRLYIPTDQGRQLMSVSIFSCVMLTVGIVIDTYPSNTAFKVFFQ